MTRTVNYYNSTSAPDEFVGARVFDTHIDFYFPHGYMIDALNESDCRKKALDVLYLITLAAPSAYENNFSSRFGRKADSIPLKSFIWLIKDYSDNGLIFSIEKRYKEGGNGRTNWARTFKNIPLPTQNGSIYLDLTAEYKTKTDNMLTIIHEYCLKLAYREIGWLFGYNNSIKIEELTDAQKVFYERYLLREQNCVFDDRKKILINHLLRILRYSIGKKDFSDKSEVGTYKFSHVWERMIQKVYGNKPLDEFFPNAIWHINGVVKDGSRLRPDTVMEYVDGEKKRLYILDAKYYRFGLYNDINLLPGSSDVQKQITYGDHAMLRHGEYEGRIKNAFVLPFRSDSDEKIQVVGYAESNWRENENSYQRVYVLLMDTEYLIRAFIAGEHGGKHFEEIMENIEKS